MKHFRKNLPYVALAALGALPVGCLAGGLMRGIASIVAGGTLTVGPFFIAGLLSGMTAILIFVVPVFLYLVPAYAWIASRQRPSIFHAIALSLVPSGIAAWVSNTSFTLMLFGLAIAISLHLIARHRVSGP